MKYKEIVTGIFVNRPNRFVAHVDIDSIIHTVHVKNTGRCKELLIPGVVVYLAVSDNLARKTQYDLVAVEKADFGLINIDSQAPNAVVKEWLLRQDFDYVKPEYTYGNSRIDFYMEKNNDKYLMEVKGCSLEIDGIGYFPDAPTERGIKHLRELTAASALGYKSILAFVIQMEGVHVVRPNMEMHPAFGQAMKKAVEAGVEILFLECKVKKDSLEIIS